MRRLHLLAFLLVLLAAQAALAQDGRPEAGRKAETEHTIYIPYKDLEKVFEKTGRGVFMPYEEFIKLWNKAKKAEEASTAPSVPVLVTAASYECIVDQKVAGIKSTYSIDVLKDGWMELPLAISGVALEQVRLDGGKALLKARKDDYLLILRGKGSHTLEAKLAAKVESKPDKRVVSFGVPRTPVSRFQITIPEPDVEVEIEPKLLATKKVTPDGQKTQVLAFVGSTDKITIIYKPKAKIAAPLAGLFFATVSTRVTFRERLIAAQARIDYEILQSLNQLKVKLPAGWRLLSVDGPDIKNWEIEEKEGRTLRVDLFTEAKKSYALKLRAEKEIEKPEGAFDVPELEVVGAARETGFFGLGGEEGIRIEAKATKNVSQVDEADLPPVARDGDVELAFKYLRHPYTISIGVSAVKPKITLRNDSLVTITPEFVTLTSQLRYTVEKRGVFSTRIELPRGYIVLKAGDPVFVKDFRISQGEKTQVLEVDFKTRLIGSFTMPLLLQLARKSAREPVDLPFARGLDASVESGFIGIGVKTGLKVVTEESAGLTPVDVEEYASKVADLEAEQDSPLQLGFQFYRHPLSAKFSVEKQKPKVAATVLTHLSLEEDLVKVESNIRYKIQHAGIKKFRFSIADKVGEDAHIEGPGIKEKKSTMEENVTTWEVQLQGDMLGEYTLNVSYDIKIASSMQKSTDVTIPELSVLDIFEENGYFALNKKETLIVSVKDTSGLELIDVKELPDALMDKSPYESYKYVSHPYKLKLSVLKQEFEKVLDAIITHMHVETEVSRELVATSKMICLVQSKGRQFLTFIMPEGSEVLALYINRKEAKRTRGETPRHVVANLSEAAPGQTSFYVEIAYKKTLGGGEMPCCGSIETGTPVPLDDIPLSRLTMRLYMPKDFKYTGLGGNMRRIRTEGEDESLWFWGKKLLFPPPSNEGSDYAVLEEIKHICKAFAEGGDMITVKLSREGKELICVRQGAGGTASVTFFKEGVFYAVDILILLITVAGLLVFARFVPVPKAAVSIGAIVVFMVLSTLASGGAREFLNTAFFGSLVASIYWVAMYFLSLNRLKPSRRPTPENRSGKQEAAAAEPQDAQEKAQDQPGHEEKGGGSDA